MYVLTTREVIFRQVQVLSALPFPGDRIAYLGVICPQDSEIQNEKHMSESWLLEAINI